MAKQPKDKSVPFRAVTRWVKGWLHAGQKRATMDTFWIHRTKADAMVRRRDGQQVRKACLIDADAIDALVEKWRESVAEDPGGYSATGITAVIAELEALLPAEMRRRRKAGK